MDHGRNRGRPGTNQCRLGYVQLRIFYGPQKILFSSFIVINGPLWSFMAKPVNFIKKFQNFVTEILNKTEYFKLDTCPNPFIHIISANGPSGPYYHKILRIYMN